MNAEHISLAFAVSAALFAGCAKSPIEEVKPSEQLTDLELSYVGAAETKVAIDGTTFPQAGEIGLFLFGDEMATQSYGDGYENIKYSYNTTKKKWTASPSIKVGSDAGYLYGYYPYKSASTDVKAIPVASSLNGDDVMFASKQAVTDATASQTSITMNHALARVSITLINSGYTGAAELSKIKFSGAKIASTGTLNALNGSITATESDVTLDVPTADRTITTAGTTYECLLVPSETVSDKQTVALTLTIGGQDKTATLSEGNGVIIARGTKSNITITLSDTGLTVQTVSVEDWNIVEVGEYKVTVKLDADVSDIKKDVWVMAYNDGEDVKIEAFSKSGKSLGCAITGEASCGTAKAENIYTFTISGISSDVTATVEYQRPTGVTLSKSNYNVSSGRSFVLSATVQPEDAYNKTCTWSSNNTSVATVDENGRVLAIADGTAEIKATTVVGGFTATCTLTVVQYEPTLPEEFSVGTDKKVRFSRGNLNYTPDIKSWWFFDNQYDSGHSESLLSLFTWGYGSWSTDWETTSYQGGDFTDWGTQVGDGETWRTLTDGEWRHLLYNRSEADEKVGFAQVCGKNGIIILPDVFEDPATNESTSETCKDKKFVPKASTGWEQNVYTAGDSWDKMEEAGALFLPAAGYRSGSTTTTGTGEYWASTKDIPGNINFVRINSSNFWITADSTNNYGRSVRLVTDVE